MATAPITLEVDAQLADAYRAAPPEAQRKMRVLIAIWLRQLVRGPRRSLKPSWTRRQRPLRRKA